MNLLLASLVVNTEERWAKFQRIFDNIVISESDAVGTWAQDPSQTTVIAEVKKIQSVLQEFTKSTNEAYEKLSSLNGKEFAAEVNNVTKHNKMLHSKVLFEMKSGGITPEQFFCSSRCFMTPNILLFFQKLCYPH